MCWVSPGSRALTCDTVFPPFFCLFFFASDAPHMHASARARKHTLFHPQIRIPAIPASRVRLLALCCSLCASHSPPSSRARATPCPFSLSLSIFFLSPPSASRLCACVRVRLVPASACMCMHVCTYVRAYACVCVCMRICMYVEFLLDYTLICSGSYRSRHGEHGGLSRCRSFSLSLSLSL